MNKKLRVLIIDDSADDTILLVRGLSHGGFEPEFERVETPEAMRAALHQTWDIIISDYAMPHFSGLGALSVLKEERTRSTVHPSFWHYRRGLGSTDARA